MKESTLYERKPSFREFSLLLKIKNMQVITFSNFVADRVYGRDRNCLVLKWNFENKNRY